MSEHNDDIIAFDEILIKGSPDADQPLIGRARNSFLRHYQLGKAFYKVDAIDTLALSFPGELKHIRNAGAKCQEIYNNARDVAKKKTELPVQDILKLKRYLYYFCHSKFKYVTSGIDRMMLQLVGQGITSRERFEFLGGMALAFPEEPWYGDENVLYKAYSELSRLFHPGVKNPMTIIVDYIDEDRKVSYTGADEDKLELTKMRLKEKDYENINTKKMERFPVLVLYVRKKEDDKNEH